MRGSAAFRAAVAPGGVLAGPWVKNELWRRARAVPSLDLRFADDKSLTDAVTGQSLVTFTRASSGTFTGSDGLIKTATTNLLLRSEEFDNASWVKNNSCTITANADVAPNGTITADQFNGAALSSTGVYTFPATTSSLVYTFSIYVKNVSNTTTLRLGVESSPVNAFVTFNATTGVITSAAANVTSSSVSNVGNGWYRVGLTYTATGTTAGLVVYSMSGSAATWLAWGAQLEQSSTVGEYIPTTSTINSAPRFDHNPTTGESLGLLVEEQRTNSIRNNTMVGAVAGTPGTIPTNWSDVPTSNGLSRQIIGVGTQSGITYIDIRYSGTTTAAASTVIQPEVSAQTVAANGQSWTASAWWALAGGSTSGLTFIQRVTGRSSVGGFLESTDTSVSLTGTLTRYAASITLANVLTARVSCDIACSYASGVAIDITLRIGLPQLEQGAFATSVIPTTTATVTRSADVPSITGANFGTTRTNLLLRSEEFDNASWDLAAGTRSANAAIAPSGTLTADKLIAATTPGTTGQLFQAVTITSGAIVTGSLFVKDGGFDRLEIVLLSNNNTTPYGRATFNPITGTITTAASTANGGTNASANVVAYTNGWYRLSVTVTYPAVTAAGMRILSFNSDSAVGDGTKGVFLWGAQLEVGSAVTPYIPTTTAAVSVFESSWYRQDEGTVFVELVPRTFANLAGVASADDNSSNNRVALRTTTSSLANLRVGVSGVTQADFTASPTLIAGVLTKIAGGYKTDDFAISANGSTAASDTSGTSPTLANQLTIGTAVGNSAVNAPIRRLTFFPQRLPNSTLVALTQ